MALPISMSDSSTAVEEKRNNVNTTFLYPICLYSISYMPIFYIYILYSFIHVTATENPSMQLLRRNNVNTTFHCQTSSHLHINTIVFNVNIQHCNDSGKTLVARNNEDACLVHFHHNFSHFLIWKWKCDIEDWKLKQADLRSKAIMVSGAPASECLE